MFSNNTGSNSSRFIGIMTSNLSDFELDISRSFNVRSDGVVGLTISSYQYAIVT